MPCYTLHTVIHPSAEIKHSLIPNTVIKDVGFNIALTYRAKPTVHTSLLNTPNVTPQRVIGFGAVLPYSAPNGLIPHYHT